MFVVLSNTTKKQKMMQVKGESTLCDVATKPPVKKPLWVDIGR